ncbi:ribonuclease H-like domain-containing protein [Tanacetum coccineum]|uniref:Ribonuclease H-like domain-containing protein n=1 Tax=Tanacetum coccineum TaxID=301880 RepID=A0ABQ4ZYW3_9ASTR
MPPSPTHTSPTQSPQAQPQSPHHPLTPRTPATHQQIPVPPLSSTHEPTTPSSTPNTHITSPAATAYGNAPTTNTHHMVTRAKAGISKPLARMNCHATTTSPIPRSHLHALPNVNIVRSMWLFKHKFNADGSLSRYKARLVANGRSQQQGIDFDETFSPVVKPATIRTVLSLAVTRDWPIHQLDVKNAFCMATIEVWIVFISSKFARGKILECVSHACIVPHCKTPLDTESKLGSYGDPVSDPTLYRSLAGALQYLTFTRPDISYAVQQICLYMHDPRDPHFTALKRILRYVRGTIDHGLQLYVSSTSQLTAYTDADWAGCPVTRRSTSGYCVFLGDNLLSWSAKRQTAWIRNLLLELHTPLFTATLVYCDNVSAVYLSTNPVQHQRPKDGRATSPVYKLETKLIDKECKSRIYPIEIKSTLSMEKPLLIERSCCKGNWRNFYEIPWTIFELQQAFEALFPMVYWSLEGSGKFSPVASIRRFIDESHRRLFEA